MEKRDYAYLLACTEGAGPLLLRRLLALYGSAEQIFREKTLPVPDSLQTALNRAKENGKEKLGERDAWEKEGIRWIGWEEAGYPRRLLTLPDAPMGLFVKGSLPPEETPSVGIVGARSCSPYGRSMAERFGGGLGQRGLSVISGMARGIDGFAQQAALRAGGRSWAVLGCGPDLCYPPGNRRLYAELAEKGGLISEYPPGTEPLPYHFPLRNRLIAAFSDVLLVLEAREKSGSLITVDQALEQGKEVMALPGRVGDDLSAGCNALIRQGAALLSCCGDVYELLGMGNSDTAAGDRIRAPLPARLEKLWRAVGTDPKHTEELMSELKEEMGSLSLKLLELEELGYIRQISGGCYVRT